MQQFTNGINPKGKRRTDWRELPRSVSEKTVQPIFRRLSLGQPSMNPLGRESTIRPKDSQSQLEGLLAALEQKNDPFWAHFGSFPTERGEIMRRIAEALGRSPAEAEQISERAGELVPLMGGILAKSIDLEPAQDANESIARTFALLLHLYGNEMRINGRMHSVCHSFRVGLRIALLTNDALYAIWALTHDLGEDKGITPQQLNEIICPRAGEMLDNLSNLRGSSLKGWLSYVKALLSAPPPAEVIKGQDTPENLGDLEGCSDRMRRDTTMKGIAIAYVARHIHPELFRYDFNMLRQHGHPELQWRVERLLAYSKRQVEAEKRGYMDDIAARQGGLTIELIGTVPYAGTRVIGVTKDGIIIVPYISGLMGAQAIEILNGEFSGMGVEWDLAPSFFPQRLQCYYIAVPMTNAYRMSEQEYKTERTKVIERLPGIIFPGYF